MANVAERPLHGPAQSLGERGRMGAAPTMEGAGGRFVIPCYKVKPHILSVLAKTPPWVEGIVCVDDACPEGSGDFIVEQAGDPRVGGGRLPRNLGVGGGPV